MHVELSNLSTDFLQIEADKSGHFLRLDRADVLVNAVDILLEKINS